MALSELVTVAPPSRVALEMTVAIVSRTIVSATVGLTLSRLVDLDVDGLGAVARRPAQRGR
ncbi:MAG: hypothetical protein R3F30_05620 [Planctomycetota bacterium]